MSREFYRTLVLVLAIFAAFMTWLHYREIRTFDRAVADCLVLKG